MIFRSNLLNAAVLAICTATLPLVGCGEQQSPPAPAAPAAVSPEQSFEEIARLIKSGLEVKGSDTMTPFSAGADRASSRLQISNEVTSQLIKPTDADTPYRGTITVTSTSTYSIRRSIEKAEEEKNHAAADNSDPYHLDDSDEADSGFSSMDNDLVSAGSDDEKARTESIESVQRRTDKDVRTYELVYQNDRWGLVTKLDPKTEKSVENAFNRALSLQP